MGLSPFLFVLLGLGEGDEFSKFPLKDLMGNFVDSCYFFIGSCDFLWFYLILHVGSILLLNVSIDQMITLQSMPDTNDANTTSYADRDASMTSLSTVSITNHTKKSKLYYYHSITLGILSSIILLYIYSIFHGKESTYYNDSGSSFYVTIVQLVVTMLIVAGNEMYYGNCFDIPNNADGNCVSANHGHIFETTYRSMVDYYDDYD